MHKIALHQGVVDKILARRGGRLHSFDDFDPRRTTLLVVDMQNCSLDRNFNPRVSHALDIVPNINRLAGAMRDAGGLVTWLYNTASRETDAEWSVYTQRMVTAKFIAHRLETHGAGTPGHALWTELDVKPGDLHVNKFRYSAFIQGASDLEAQLRRRAIDTLLVVGTGTGTCCESTARDAMMLNFATIMVSDANACSSDEEHNASLSAFLRNFGDVMSTDETIGFIRRNAAAAAARQKAG